MIKKLSLAALLAASTLTANAQKVNYSVVETDPDRAKTTTLDLQFLNLGTYQGFGMGYGIKAETMLTDKIGAFLEYKNTYFETPNSSSASSELGAIVPSAGLKHNMNIEAGGTYFFLKRKVASNVKVQLSSMSFGNVTVIHYTSVPSLVQHMLGARGGLTYFQKALDFESASHKYFNYKSKDGKTNVPIDEEFAGLHVQPDGNSWEPFTNSKVFAIFAGLDYRNIRNTIIQAEDYGRCANATSFDIYFDLMVAPSISFANVIDTARHEWQIVPTSKGTSNFGYRFGVTRHPGRTVGFSSTLEFGKKPSAVMGAGFFNTGGYINYTISLCISSALNLLGHKPAGAAHKMVDKKETTSEKI